MKIELYDIVILANDLPEKGLKAGMMGAVVMIYEKPALAYEVEFCDGEGRSVGTNVLLPDQITKYTT